KNNITTVTEFILMGFTDYHMLEVPLFLMFLIFYIITLLGNVGMIILIQVDIQLHTPMYFFLSHLALLDACYASQRPSVLESLIPFFSSGHLLNIEAMAPKNLTAVTEFILVGFTDHPELVVPLFLMFLIFYIVALLGNVGMIILIQMDVQLHTPMYFFLSHLALLDACYASVITPQILATLATSKTAISFGQCVTQFFFFTVCAGTECFLLAAMAYDRLVAISNPLRYNLAMTPNTCRGLLAAAYVCGVSGAILRTKYTFTLSFCDHNQINFFFCDLPPLLKLACNGMTQSATVILFFAKFMFLANVMIILVSYALIIRAILRVKSAGGRAKTFSTCTSHLTTVVLFFGTLAFMYQRSQSDQSPEEDKIVSVFYTIIIPMLNPLIYSLRNKDVKAAFRKLIGKIQFPK
ncbi:OR9I1 protein, partial [Crocuta crocuta]